jgi:hypothetical protein
LSSRAGRKRSRRWRSGQKRVGIALGQELERAFPNLGADEYEFRVNLPRLDLHICGLQGLVDLLGLGLDGRLPPRNRPKPAVESKCGFEGDGTQTVSGIGV